MARVCELTGKRVLTGNNVSHANNRTKRRFIPNLNQATLTSDILQQKFRLRVCASALRTIDHRGGLDNYLQGTSDETLSPRAIKIKRSIVEASAADE